MALEFVTSTLIQALHFLSGATDAQRGYVAHPKSHSKLQWNWVWTPGPLASSFFVVTKILISEGLPASRTVRNKCLLFKLTQLTVFWLWNAGILKNKPPSLYIQIFFSKKCFWLDRHQKWLNRDTVSSLIRKCIDDISTYIRLNHVTFIMTINSLCSASFHKGLKTEIWTYFMDITIYLRLCFVTVIFKKFLWELYF